MMAPPSFADQAPAIVHENLQHMVGERVRVVFFDDPTSSDEKLDGRLGEVMAVGSVERCAEAIESGTLVDIDVRLDDDAAHAEGEPTTRKFPARCLIHAEHRHGEPGAETVTPEDARDLLAAALEDHNLRHHLDADDEIQRPRLVDETRASASNRPSDPPGSPARARAGRSTARTSRGRGRIRCASSRCSD